MMKRQVFVYPGLLVLLLSLSLSTNTLAKQYKVKTGDSLYSISKEFGVSINEVKEGNNLQGTILKPNQVLDIPEKNTTDSTTKPKSKYKTNTYYIVKKGDTLSKIAKKTGVSVKQIIAFNNVHAKSLRIGRKLVLAKSTRIAENESTEDDDNLLTEEEEEIAQADKSDELENEKRTTEEFLGKWNNPDERKLFVKVATGFLGAPYRLGGSTVRGFDCSAFVRKIYLIFDIDLPRNAREQSKVGVSINREELVEGDLVFFRTRRPLGHVGIYIGNNEFVHASYKSKVIRIDSLDTPYFQKRFQRAVRIKVLDNTGT